MYQATGFKAGVGFPRDTLDLCGAQVQLPKNKRKTHLYCFLMPNVSSSVGLPRASHEPSATDVCVLGDRLKLRYIRQ